MIKIGIAAAIGLVGAGYWTGFRATSAMFGPFPYQGETDERVVALTFDDGPNEPYTSQLLAVLDRHQVRATFFQVGRCAERFPSVTRRVVESGHVLGNHSYHHEFHRYASEPDQQRQISMGQLALSSVAGVTPALYRPPWLCHWPWVLDRISSANLQVVSGIFAHPLEVFQPPARVMATAAARHVRPGSILIFHDGVEARGGGGGAKRRGNGQR
ncbi:MAG: polysaccharide deacetylase family protein, partial [Propionibacteriaceae bacterium]